MQMIDLRYSNDHEIPVMVPDDAQPVMLRCAPVEGATTATLTVGGDDLGPPTLQLGDPLWHWHWQPRGRVGRFAVRLEAQRASAMPLVLHSMLVVAPGKIDRDAYEYLLTAIQRVAVGLVLDFTGGGIAAAWEATVSGPRSVAEEYWTRLVAETASATAAAERLNRGAYETWRHREQEQELHEIDMLRGDMLARLVERPLEETDAVQFGRLLPGFPRGTSQKPRLPRTLPVRSMVPTVHRYEHAVLVRILLELHARCVWVREALARELAWRGGSVTEGTKTAQLGLLTAWLHEVNGAAAALMRCRTAALLADVEPIRAWKGPTELMRRDRRYRAIAQAWQTLWQRPFVAVHSPAFELPVDDLPSLYECWCLLEVAQAMATVGELVEQHLCVPERGVVHGVGPTVWNVRLPEDRPLVRRRSVNGVEWRLWYHRRFAPHMGQGAQLGSLDPFLRVPDIVIEMVRPGSAPRLIIFDAKYRLTATGNLSEDVLETAYAYHGGLGYAGEPASVATFVLFPGTEGFEAGGVGAVPLVPGIPSRLAEVIRRIGAGC
jgi:hypothetical protein